MAVRETVVTDKTRMNPQGAARYRAAISRLCWHIDFKAPCSCPRHTASCAWNAMPDSRELSGRSGVSDALLNPDRIRHRPAVSERSRIPMRSTAVRLRVAWGSRQLAIAARCQPLGDTSRVLRKDQLQRPVRSFVQRRAVAPQQPVPADEESASPRLPAAARLRVFRNQRRKGIASFPHAPPARPRARRVINMLAALDLA